MESGEKWWRTEGSALKSHSGSSTERKEAPPFWEGLYMIIIIMWRSDKCVRIENENRRRVVTVTPAAGQQKYCFARRATTFFVDFSFIFFVVLTRKKKRTDGGLKKGGPPRWYYYFIVYSAAVHLIFAHTEKKAVRFSISSPSVSRRLLMLWWILKDLFFYSLLVAFGRTIIFVQLGNWGRKGRQSTILFLCAY